MVHVIGQLLGFIGSLCLLLFGMEMLSNGIQKGAGNSLQSLLHKISGNRFTAVLTGIAVTAIIQSSGATTVMTVSFVNAEIITLTQAIGIIFGANIGTTVTAWIVSLFGFSFSIEAAAIPLFGFGFILKYFKKLRIHNFSDCFMGFALLFLPFVNQIASCAKKLVPESQKELDAHYKMPVILPFNHVSADLYTIQIQKEISKMSARVMEMMDCLGENLSHKNEKTDLLIEKLNAQEEYVDEMNHEITGFLQKCSRLPTANHNDRDTFARMISTVQNLEDLSDECCSMMHTVCKIKNDGNVLLPENQFKELQSYFEQVHIFYDQTCTYIALGLSEIDKVLLSDVEDQIDKAKRELKKASRKRIENGSNVKAELNYMDLVRKIEKAGDCVFGVIRAIQPSVTDSLLSDGSENNLLSAQNVIINTQSRKVFVSGNEIQLAVKEYDLLLLLMEKKGEIVTREQLFESIWNYEKETETRTLDVHVRLLRQKLNNKKLIETVRGIGYRING